MEELGALGKLDWGQVEVVDGKLADKRPGRQNALAFCSCVCQMDNSSYSNICSTDNRSKDN